MSTNTTTAKGRSTGISHIAEGLFDGFEAVRSNLAMRAERRRVTAQLSRMTDRELSDIGITRSDIPFAVGSTQAPR